MTQHRTFKVTLIDGLPANNHRGIAFLECMEDDNIDAKKVFEGLNKDRKRDVLSRFDYWLSGGTHNKYFHGWPNNPNYKECL